MARFNHTLPSRIIIGDGVSTTVGSEAKKMGITRVLVVSDKGVESVGVLGPICESLEKVGLKVEKFLGVLPNPTADQVRAAEQIYKSAGCDGVVAVGGGSVMDVAKSVRIMAKHPGDIMDYELGKGGLAKITADQPPLICLATTSGTGSEVSVGAIITDDKTHVKKTIVSPFVVPTLALDDPKLTHGLPPFQTASTGMDALTHAIEAYVSKMDSPFGGALALEAIQLIGKSLVTAVKEPTNARARHDMMYASMIAGIAFSQNNLGAVHALAHQLSTEFGFAHGFANALMLVPVMKYNLESAPAKYAQIAIALGADRKKSDAELAKESVDLVERLRIATGLPGLIREGKGARATDLKRLASQAMMDVCHVSNPRPCSPAVMEQLFAEAGADAA
ncbi:MAG: iron-containing alcohol dehydrogenase [Deltaproteobacteria bacterium]|nr:iron-containing alcohol dehydrogenase [Deltaproteobacteria bacterium]